jgi:ketosteroid isomerase-like protein
MAQENVDFVKGLYEGVEAMDKEQLLEALPELIPETCDPEIEWIEDPKRADSRTYRGHDGVIESWKRWLDGFDQYGAVLEEVVDCGDRVLVSSRESGRGAISGATVDATNHQVLTFRDGKLLRYQEFYDEADARRAAGLTD